MTTVERAELSNSYVLRYMLKKPKKFERDNLEESVRKKRTRSPTKVEFDDVLYYG